jgi:hypothetical protein
MWTRRIAAGVLIVLFSSASLASQTNAGIAGSRLRLRGLHQYEIPGVLRLDGRQVSASSGSDIGRTTIRVLSPAHGYLTVLRPGTRLVGRLVDVTPDTLSLAVENGIDPITIPLDSLASVERSVRPARRHIVRGILAGVGAFFGTGALVFSQCGLGCEDSTVALATFGAGIAAGAWAWQGRERWTTVSTSDLVPPFVSASP